MASSDSDESDELLIIDHPSEPSESAKPVASKEFVDSVDEVEVEDEQEKVVKEEEDILQLDLLLKDEVLGSSSDRLKTEHGQCSILSRMIPPLKTQSTVSNQDDVKNKTNLVINTIDQVDGVISLVKLKEQAPSPDDYVRGSLVLSNGKSIITNMPLMSWCVLSESLAALEYLLDEFEDEFDPILPCLDGPFQGKTCFELLDLLRLNLLEEDDSFENGDEAKPDEIHAKKNLEEEERKCRQIKSNKLKKLDLIMHELKKYQQKHVDELLIETIEPNRKWLEPFLIKACNISPKNNNKAMNEIMIGMARCGLITNDRQHSKDDCLNILATIDDQDMDDLGEFIPDLTVRNQLVESAKQIVFKDNNNNKKTTRALKTSNRVEKQQDIPLWKLAIFQILLLAFFGWIFVVLSKNKEYQEMFRSYGMID